MLVVGIYGSPREEGNTDLMLNSFLDGAAAAGGEIRRIYVRDIEISGCLACGGCDSTGTCIQEDDMVDVYPLIETAQRIVVASPIFFYGITGQLKLLIDRSQAPYMRAEISKKEGKNASNDAATRKGFLLSAGATRGKRLFECAVLTVRYFFDALSMSYAGDLCFRDIEEKGAIRQHSGALEACYAAGENFVRQG